MTASTITRAMVRWTLLAAIVATAAWPSGGERRAVAAEDAPVASSASPHIRLLFLGDDGHHKPRDRAAQLIPVMKARGIEVTYSDNVNHLNPSMLNQYDGLIIYANTTSITPEQEAALLDYVSSGGGFIPLHCASYCFLNSQKYIDLVGAQFKSHGTGTFSVDTVAPDHAIMRGYKGFESWDETYVHAKHNDRDRTVLETRKEGDRAEPWTWVRTPGKGRVFYTAWGHDERTWSNPGFQSLVERGIRWATEPRVKARLARDVKPFSYIKATDAIPNYTPGKAWGTQAKPLDMMQAPLPGAESAKHIVTPPGMHAEYFAGDPDMRPALAMAWDARGRLWLCESVDYPNNLQPQGQGHDSIRICEDTDGDGKADKFSVFAENLSIPTALTFYRGGVIAQVGTETIYFQDTDGDDKADVRKVLITGWSQGDTHGGVSNFTPGLDNWVWGMQGYNNSSPRFGPDMNKQAQAFRMGFFRFKLDHSVPPNVTDVEFIRSTNNNTWGLGLSEEGLVFGSTANRNPSEFMSIPNRYYERVRGWAPQTLGGIANNHYFFPISDAVRQVDQHGGYTAGAGHRLYTARLYPREYWNRTAFVTGPTGKLTGTFVLRPQGSGFASSNDWNIVASDDEWYAPIAAEVGPDGCVWILDWYNYIVQHNPTPVGFKTGKGNAYDTNLRDKVHGRVQRVVPDAAKLPGRLSLDGASPEALVAALGNDNMFWRQHAQRLLVERGNSDVVPALVALIRNRSADALGLNVAAIHALWTLQGLGALDGTDATALAAAVEALRHPSAGVRRNAVQVLPTSDDALRAILDSGLLNDDDAQVRLTTLLAVADMPASIVSQATSDRAAAAVFAMLQQPRNADDRWIPDAATAAAAAHDAGFIRAVLGGSRATGKVQETPKPEQPKPQPVNLVKNGSLEEIHNNAPQGWRTVTYNGQASLAVALGEGRNGSNCVRITSKAGADASWTYDLPVKPNTRYRVTAWVKTKGFKKTTGLGALINLHELQKVGKTEAITTDKDWTLIKSEFETGGNTRLALNLLYGGWGHAVGEAWWDDVEVIEVGPATGAPAIAGAASAVSGRVGQVVSIVTRHYAERGPVDSVVDTLASLKGANEDLSGFVLSGLVSGWPTSAAPKLTDVDKAQVSVLMRALPASQRDALIVLLRRWGQENVVAGDLDQVRALLTKTIADESQTTDARVESARRLVRLTDDANTVAAILKPISPQASSELAVGLIGALGDSRQDATGADVIANWEKFTPAARRAALSVVMRREGWTQALLETIKAGTLHQADLAAADWQVLKLHKNAAIAKLATELDANRGSADRAKVLAQMLPYLDRKGNVDTGKQVFTKLCAQCHSIAGQGGKVGPDLTGIGTRPAHDILAEIVDPNRSVESNFRLWIIETEDGERLSGRLDSESKTTVELLDIQGNRHVIQRKAIVDMSAQPISIMPVGVIDQLKPDEVASLMTFLRSGH